MIVRRSSSAIAAVALLLAGCTGTDAGNGSTGQDEDGESTSSAAEDEVEEEPLEPSGRLLLTGFADHQAAGLSLALRAVEVVEGGHLLVEIEAVNSGTGTSRLSGLNTFLEDDRGNRYPFVRPPDNNDLALGSDQRMTGTLAFEGPIDPEARRFVLAFNQSPEATADEVETAADSPETNQFAPFGFRDVPLPGVGLEEEATAGDPGSLLDEVTVEVDQTASPEDNPDVEVTVVGYTTDGRTLELDLEVVNRSDTAVRMLAQSPELTDDLGSRFHFRPGDGTQAEQRLELQPGEEGSATIGFRATLLPQASELRLTLNSFGLRRANAAAPGIRFTLPMPDGSGEDDQ